ncbi:MAG: copper homeostasis protein CutC [Sphingobacteriales bacterium]|nr:copper homeostasis protein CutC [Sphingobacteriales bacterium]
MNYTLELVSFTLHSCKIASDHAVQRIELCDNDAAGGTTPSAGFIHEARKIYAGELCPIIRPRGGDFVYSDAEFQSMLYDISICKDAGCDGVVAGILLTDGSIDAIRTKTLIQYAYPMDFCFHRAFDRVKDPFESMEQLIDLGIQRILSSGLQPTAALGAPLLRELIEKADGRIEIMPGSGIRKSNILEIAKATGATQLHSSAKTMATTQMNYVNEAMAENLTYPAIDEVELAGMLDLLKSL